MVYRLKIVIFHGYVSHNRMVILPAISRKKKHTSFPIFPKAQGLHVEIKLLQLHVEILLRLQLPCGKPARDNLG